MTETEINWDAPPRRRPKMPGLAPLPPGTVTVTITCRVCGTRAPVEVSAPAKLCRECASDLAGTRAHVETLLASCAAREAAASAAWTQYLTALPDDLSARFDRLWSDRTQAETTVRQAERAKGPSGATPAAQLDRLAAARAALEAIQARITKTRTNADNPLAAVLDAEAAYHAAIAQCRSERRRWEQAMQEVEAADDGGVPF